LSTAKSEFLNTVKSKIVRAAESTMRGMTGIGRILHFYFE
jgi:hypothetical protein